MAIVDNSLDSCIKLLDALLGFILDAFKEGEESLPVVYPEASDGILGCGEYVSKDAEKVSLPRVRFSSLA